MSNGTRAAHSRLTNMGKIMEARKRVLVVFYSLNGNTVRVARDLAVRLDADVERIRERRERRGPFKYLLAALDSAFERSSRLGDIGKQAKDYDLTIVGSPVWVGKFTPAIRAYLNAIRGKGNDVAFFTTSGNTPAEKVVPAMEKLVERQAVASVGFTEAELRNAAIYDGKLRAFIASLGIESASVAGQGNAHAHA